MPMIGAILLYAAASQPAPRGFGLVEVAVGILLLVSVGLGLMARGRRDVLAAGAADGNGRLLRQDLSLFAGLLLLPLFGGVLSGAEPRDIVRDVVPLGFLFLPLFMAGGLRSGDEGAVALALAAAGTVFAGRWWAQVAATGAGFQGLPLLDGPDYLLNSAAVAFAATHLPLL